VREAYLLLLLQVCSELRDLLLLQTPGGSCHIGRSKCVDLIKRYTENLQCTDAGG